MIWANVQISLLRCQLTTKVMYGMILHKTSKKKNGFGQVM